MCNVQSFLSGVSTLQTYAGNKYNSSYYGNMCYHLEESLMRGLRMPGETEVGSPQQVDVKGSLCASGGWYGKTLGSTYTAPTARLAASVVK
jgi:hypothetical protein